MNQLRPAGLHLRYAILAGVLSLIASRETEATVLKNVTLAEQGSLTMLTIEADGPVTCQDFLLANPDRLVLECPSTTSLLPPRVGAANAGDPQGTGRVRAITSEQWTGKDGQPVSRVVCELTARASYSIAQRSNGLVVILENGTSSTAEGIGYDEDRLAQSGPRTESMPVEAGGVESGQQSMGAYAGSSSTAPSAGPAGQTASPASAQTSAQDKPLFRISPKSEIPTYMRRAYGSGERIDARPGANKRVSLDVQRASVATVLRTLAELSGRNIVSNQEVKGEVTVRLEDVPWPQALDIVLLTRGLGFSDEEGVLRIASLEQLRKEQSDAATADRKVEEFLPLETRVVRCNFAKAEEVKPAVDKLLTTRGHCEPDKRTNSLVISDISERVAMATSLVDQLDTRTPQVEIESKLVDVDVSEATDIGIDWTLTLTADGGADALNREQQAISRNPIANPAGELRVGTIQSNYTLDMVLQALAEDRDANIISNPRITTVNNREASILVGQEIPLIVQDEAFNTVVQLKQIGIKLTVRPHINSDRQVELDVHPEVSDLSSQATVQGGIIINTSEANTRVLVNDGQTAVMGGLIRENEATRERGIPVLMDIPALGWLFRSSSVVKQKRELLIFITPRIVGA
jgi:type IV pilus secretin PilQ/predicted competence protein